MRRLIHIARERKINAKAEVICFWAAVSHRVQVHLWS
jgi:hypothetical protein